MSAVTLDDDFGNPQSPVEIEGLDPQVTELGVMVGLLREKSGAPGTYELNPTWFEDPIGKTATALKTNGNAIGILLTTLLGSIGGKALGIPVKDPGNLGTWYPIQNPDTGKPTGLYILSRTVGDQTVLGIGTQVSWQLVGDVELRVWGVVPLVALGAGGIALAAGSAAYPFEVGIEVASKTPIIDRYGFSFNGLKASATLGLTPEPAVQLSLVVLQLKLPTDDKPSDRSLADIEQLTGEQILSAVSSLFVGALSEAVAQQESPRIGFLLPLLGLSPKVPAADFSDVRLPILRWDQIITYRNSDPARPFKEWFNALLAAPELLEAWLVSLAGVLGLEQLVTGAGTRDAPYRVTILTTDAGSVAFTAASAVDDQARRTFYPGVDFAATKIALGTSAAALRMDARLELAQFTIAGTKVSADPTSLRFAAGICLVGKGESGGKDDPLFKGTIGNATYEFGALCAGLTLGNANGLQIIPRFELVNVVTPNGSYASLNLTQPGDVVDKAEQELYALINNMLQQLFGLAGGETSPGYSIGALLGIVPPSTGDPGVKWPKELPPPLSAAQIAKSIQNPAGALAAYYAKLLSDEIQVGGKTPFFYMVRQAALLFQEATSSGPVAVSGSGKPDDPWRAALNATESLAISLLTWFEPLPAATTRTATRMLLAKGEAVPQRRRLILGLALTPKLQIGGTLDVDLGFKADLLGLDLTSGATLPTGVHILPGLGLTLGLPKGVTSPTVAGAAITVARSGISVRWSPYDGWQWSMLADAPALLVDGNTYPVGEDMVFTDAASLEKLVTDQAAKFARILTGILGIAVYRTGTRAGLALNGIVGLLPNLKALMPQGIDWPTDMPALALTSFSDPLGALRAQIAGVLATPARTKAALQLLSWSATSSDPKALRGSGTLADPYHVSFGLASDIGLAVWNDEIAKTAGIGIDHLSTRALPGGLEAGTRLTVRLLNGSLLEGKLKPIEGEVPGAVLTTNIRRPNGKLIPPTAGISLGSITLGVRLAVSGDLANPVVTARPLVLLLDLELPGHAPIASINVADKAASTELAQLLEQTLDLAIGKVLAAAQDPVVAKVYALLAKMGLTLDPVLSGASGINPAGWTALLADPLPFLRDRLVALAADPASRRDIIQLLLDAAGVTLPPIPPAVKEILAALGLLDEVGLPDPAAFVQLFSHPVDFLGGRFRKLLTNEAGRLDQLISALQQIVEPLPFGPFELQVLAGPVVTIRIVPAKAARIGSILEVSGAATLNFAAGTQQLGLDLRLFNPQTRLSIVPALRVPFGSAPVTFTLETQWGDGSMPAPSPIRFYPFDAGVFVQSLSKVAPFYALSIVVGQVVDPLLLQKYKLVEVVFRALGIAEASGGKWTTKSLLGLFDDPAAWLLSGAVIGENGRLNIGKLQTLLGEMPEVTSTLGVGTKKVPNGFRVDGLPYQFAVDFTADAAAQRFRIAPLLAKPMPVAGGNARVETLRFGVALGPDFQPGFEGAAGVSVPALSGGLTAEAGFVDGPYLRVRGGGEKPPVLQLVPFPGWQTLVQEAGQILVQELLPRLTDKLLEALANSGAKAFADALRIVGTELDIARLLAALVGAAGDAKKLEAAALGWLGGRLTKVNAEKTANAVVALLTPLTIDIKREKALLRYQPSSSLPITLLAGATELGGKYQLGGWVAVSLPSIAIVRAGIEQTGVGIEFNPDTGIPAGGPLFNFGVVIDTPIPGEDRAPRLELRFDNASSAFVAGLDPLGKSGTRSDLYRELLPKFFRDKPDVGAWIVAILKDAAPRYLSIVLLNQTTVRGWLDSPILKSIKPGEVLKKAEILDFIQVNDKYVLRTVDQLAVLTPQAFLGGLLEGLFSAEITIVTFGENRGDITVGPSREGAGDVGLRVTARDLALAQAPNFVFQLGASDSKWIKDDKLKPGFGVFVPLVQRLPRFEKTKLQVVNLGVDFVGKQQTPLIELSRFSLGKIKPRGLVTFDFSLPGVVDKYGAAITLEQIALSLAPNTMSTSKNANPVAQNLLGSGAQTKEAKPNPPANPGFNARVSYLKGASYPDVLFYSGKDEGSTDVWIPVQRDFGPLAVNMIGLGWKQETTHLRVLFDGSVSLLGLYVGLEKLAVGFNVKAPTDVEQYTFDLAALDIQFKGGPVELSGGFFKQETPYLRYDGAALLKAASFSFAALGSYGVIPIDPNDPSRTAASLFVFVNLNAPLGGPPAFFVMGIAAGFGYNRSLRIPGPGDIGEFPLVAGAIRSDFFEKGPDGKADPTKALKKLSDYVPPVVGVFWVGAGVKGSTFQFLDVFALLLVTFGREFAIDLIGVISAGLPPKSPKTIAYIELAMIASFRPTEGLLSLRAQLTPNSYILAPQCKLTGGFALMWWFSGPNSGEFVITIGGYHPAYQKPKIYPDVPRLGLSWVVDVTVGRLTIIGGVYFALTPSAIMAGGSLDASFELGPLRAWLSAGANFLIQFKPFYYDIGMWISIGVSFRLELAGVKVTLTAALSAALELWGPPTAGKAEITWYIISITIPIGVQDKSLQTRPLGTWAEFATNFLPPPATPPLLGDAPKQEILKASARLGMLQEDGPRGWVIRPTAWSLVQETLIPATTMTVTGSGQVLPAGPGMGVRPMEVSKVETPLTVTIEGFDVASGQWKTIDLAARKIVVASASTAAPAALWSKDPLNLDQPPNPETSVLRNANTGVSITGVEATEVDRIGPIPMEKAFAFEPGKPRNYAPWTPFAPPAALGQTDRFARLTTTIMSATVIATRTAVLKALRDHNVAALEAPNLSVIAANADNLYLVAPTLAQLGGQVPVPPKVERAARAQETPASPRDEHRGPAVRLLGAVRRYRAASGVQGRWIDRESHPAAALDAFGGGAGDTSRDVRMFDGSVAVCAIEGRATLRVGGELAVRVVAFNEHDEVLRDFEAAAGTQVTLPDETAKAALQGGALPDDVVAGWRHDTLLVRAARYTFLGDGCTVRPQATPLRRTRSGHLSRGVIEAAALLAENRVSDGGALRGGWVETLLPSTVRNVVVAVNGSALLANAVRVRIVRTGDPWNPPYGEAAPPADLDFTDGRIELRYDAPAGEGHVAVLVQIDIQLDDDALALDGVWGFASLANAALHASGVPLGAAAPPASTVTLTVEEAAR
jgi:hypothetical protein